MRIDQKTTSAFDRVKSTQPSEFRLVLEVACIPKNFRAG